MIFTSITQQLDAQNIKYISISNSKAYDLEDVKTIALERLNDTIGRELIEAVPVWVNDDLAIAVAPATEKISLNSLQEQLGTGKVNFLEKHEVEKLFADYEFGTIPPVGCLHQVTTYCAKSIYTNNSEVTFYVGSYRHRIRMTFENYKKVANLKENIQFDTTPRYRASVRDRIPLDIKQRMKTIPNCILGVSISNSNFSTPKLVAITDWINTNFTNCKVMIGDSLFRLTLQIMHDKMHEKEALQKALFFGQKFINDERILFDRHQETCDFEFILASEVQRQEDYKSYHKDILNLFESSANFNHSVMSFSQKFVRRNIEDSDPNLEKKRQLSATYLLEELAIFSCLIKGGYPIMIYPGSIDILIEIAKGSHPNLPASLQELMYISLFLKRRK